MSDIINKTSAARSIIIRGLPYSVKKFDVIKHLNGHCLVDEKNIHFEKSLGRKTGLIGVIFDTPRDAEIAREKYNRKCYGNTTRVASIHVHTERFFKMKCNLRD